MKGDDARVKEEKMDEEERKDEVEDEEMEEESCKDFVPLCRIKQEPLNEHEPYIIGELSVSNYCHRILDVCTRAIPIPM